MADKNLSFITNHNQKGKPALLHKGHRYNFCKTNSSGTSLWRCVNREECSASISLNENRDEIIRQTRHSCASHREEYERALMMDACQQEVSEMCSVSRTIGKRGVKGTLATMAVDGKCTFGTRPPVDLVMLNEKIYREVKHFRNYKTYRPNFGSLPVATKFYAAHDQLKTESEEQAKEAYYAYNVAQTRAKGPHSKYPAPVTESHVYGWYTAPLVPFDRNDNRFYHPKRESPHTKIEVIIRMCNPKNRT